MFYAGAKKYAQLGVSDLDAPRVFAA